TNMVADWLERRLPPLHAAAIPDGLPKPDRILPVLRGTIGDVLADYLNDPDAAMPVMDLRANAAAVDFLASVDLATASGHGVASPDHVLRTKRLPLVLDTRTLRAGEKAIHAAVACFVDDYRAYFDRNVSRFGDEKRMVSPHPCVAWIEGIGVLGIGANAQAANAAADLAEQTLVVIRRAEAAGGFRPIDETDTFACEYWSLEQAKLGKGKLPAFTGRVVLVTGGAGTIGLATAKAFAAQGAQIFLVDRDEHALAAALDRLGRWHGGIACDITADGGPEGAMTACVERFGGLDILVSNAGTAVPGDISTMSDATLRRSFELNFFAHNAFAQAAIRVFRAQGRGGQILFNISKQAVNPGKGLGAYGLPKATTFFLLRQLALELGAEGIRVNGVNADRIRSGLLNDDFIAERAKARGVDEAAYMANNILEKEVEAHHVAKAFVDLACSDRTTAHVMTVDGGNIEAALR
ncbi:MAG: SDR family NAD(P)-dependent oxidoreductase, partial [Pseudomonadota bacterium]